MSNDLFSVGLPSTAGALDAYRSQELDGLQRMTAEGSDAAALKFQALLATMLVREMRRSVPEGFFGEAAGADTFNAWMDEHLGAVLAEQDALGLAGQIKASLGSLERAAEAPDEPKETR